MYQFRDIVVATVQIANTTKTHNLKLYILTSSLLGYKLCVAFSISFLASVVFLFLFLLVVNDT